MVTLHNHKQHIVIVWQLNKTDNGGSLVIVTKQMAKINIHLVYSG